ncbi:MAG: AAA family ATPase [Deltaproteobacteria bacterium]|nr:AAA family ATPase [Deltaproteobacteria bacterium]
MNQVAASKWNPSAKINSLDTVRETARILHDRMKAAVQGRDDVIDIILYALLGDGHVLLEDYPGSGKTTLAKALGESIFDDVKDDIPHFRRVQFTPDLLPSDITGVMVFDSTKNEFYFRAGPLFSYVVLADEINRTSPKVQSALLEAMAEKQVTVDNTTHKLDNLFFVIATQNPLDLVGTYPLPVAQLDRFLFKVRMQHITRDAEFEVLTKWNTDRLAPDLPKVSRTEILNMRAFIRENVRVSDAVMACLVDIFRALREEPSILQGASTRAMVLAIPALQARAVLDGRDFISASDIEALLIPLLIHRLEFKHGVTEKEKIIHQAAKPVLEHLARSTLKK